MLNNASSCQVLKRDTIRSLPMLGLQLTYSIQSAVASSWQQHELNHAMYFIEERHKKALEDFTSFLGGEILSISPSSSIRLLWSSQTSSRRSCCRGNSWETGQSIRRADGYGNVFSLSGECFFHPWVTYILKFGIDWNLRKSVNWPFVCACWIQFHFPSNFCDNEVNWVFSSQTILKRFITIKILLNYFNQSWT